MAEKLPKYTWAADTLTLKGIRRVVYSTVTGNIVGEIRDGKFIQLADKIPQPTVKPKKVSKPSNDALAARNANAMAILERDASFYRGVAENIDESAASRADARDEYNRIQGEIAKLQVEAEKLGFAKKTQEAADVKTKAREDFNKIKEEYQNTQTKLGALVDQSRKPELNRKLQELATNAAELYKTFTGRSVTRVQAMDLLAGKTAETAKTEVSAGPTGTTSAPSETKPAITGAQVRTPLPKGTVVSNFNAGQFRQGEEASMQGFVPGTPSVGGGTDAQIMAQAQALYGNIDEIFSTNDELKKLLRKAVEGKYDVNRFTNELEGTNWFKQNAGPIRQRGFYKRQYDALVEGLKKDDPNYQAKIEELNKTSEYGRGLQNAIESVTDEWTRQYGTPTAEDQITINTIADEIYRYANEGDLTKIRNAVLTKPKIIKAGTVSGGATGQNLQALRSIAAANGLDLDRDFGTSIQTWMDRLAKGESIETIKSLIRNTAKTTWNTNDRISGLLDQGVDLNTIYAPYRTRMANILEIAPDAITFNDLASKGIIGGKEEKNLYDFEKELRLDPRWQYTRNAKQEVSNAALQVLRDFGFQG